MKTIKNYLFIIYVFLLVIPVTGQVFSSRTVLYSNTAWANWFTENQYNAIDSYNGSVYFIMLDNTRRPFVGKITNGVTTLQPLEKDYPTYKPIDDGHQEYSIGIDKDGYIHVTGDMHNYPQEGADHIPAAYKGANILYWKSKYPGDISDFDFMGKSTSTIPGSVWSYGRFSTDRNGTLYYISRTLARSQYYQNGGRGVGLYVYNTATKQWTARGTKAPISDATYPVIAWEESGQSGGSYQQYKADIRFDANNRMYITTGMNTANGPAQVNSILFAYSDDGGVTFHKANGAGIQLPMQVKSGTRQGDVIDVDPQETFEQPGVTHAFNNHPVVFYTKGNSSYYKYWTGTAWSSPVTAPVGIRGKILFNEHSNQLLFVSIGTGMIYSKSSFTGTVSSYDAGETFRYFDLKTFMKTNILNGISWKTATGKFEVIQLKGPVTATKDCAGVTGGTASIDQCGVCSGGTTGKVPNATCKDCAGVVNGTASIDQCGVCSGGTTGKVPNSTCKDCAGVINGTASIDQCGVCSGGTTGKVPNASCKDCSGVINGTASIDQCGVCSGGTTGKIPNATCKDCNGTINGSARIDQCGICSGGTTGIAPCAVLQGEAACDYEGVIETVNAGFKGAAYLNTDNKLGAFGNWSVIASADKLYSITIRYANGQTIDRKADVYVNGVRVQSAVSFPPTGAWTIWKTVSINPHLINGKNIIELRAITSEGLANIDELLLSDNLSVGSCDGVNLRSGGIILSNDPSSQIDASNEVYPNPTEGILNLSKAGNWEVYSSFGELLMQGNSNTINLDKLSAGMYYVKVNGKMIKIQRL